MLRNTSEHLAAQPPPLQYKVCLVGTEEYTGTATGVSFLTLMGHIKKKPKIRHRGDRVPFPNRAEEQCWCLLAELIHMLLFQQILAALLPAVHSYFLFLVRRNESMSFQDNKQVVATVDS